jgi:hypothetical protein
MYTHGFSVEKLLNGPAVVDGLLFLCNFHIDVFTVISYNTLYTQAATTAFYVSHLGSHMCATTL